MPKSQYQIELEGILKNLNPNEKKPSLLLHACCAPCSSYVLEFLSRFFEISIYYYNPNIHPEGEYHRRLEELKKFLPEFQKELQANVSFIEADYISQEYFDAIQIEENPELASEPERGERCRRCYLLRMKKAAEYARAQGFDYFTTTLSISPHKDAQKINEIGRQLEAELGQAYLPADFKKANGFKRSLELSAEYGLYRQDYCGCIYSAHGRMQGK